MSSQKSKKSSTTLNHRQEEVGKLKERLESLKTGLSYSLQEHKNPVSTKSTGSKIISSLPGITSTASLTIADSYPPGVIKLTDPQSGNSVEFFWEDGLLYLKGSPCDGTVQKFIEITNKSLMEKENLPVVLEMLLAECAEFINESKLNKTNKGRKLLSKIKSYYIGE